MSSRLGKKNIFEDTESIEQVATIEEKTENTIYMVRPSERALIDDWVYKHKNVWRGLNSSMVVRSLMRVFGNLNIEINNPESELILENKITEALKQLAIDS